MVWVVFYAVSSIIIKRLLQIADEADDSSGYLNVLTNATYKSATNPIASFRLVSYMSKMRPTSLGEELDSLLIEGAPQTPSIIDEINYVKSLYPTDVDVKGSIDAILRLQDTYQLSSEQLTKSQLPGVPPSNRIHMTAVDCFEIAKMAYTYEDFYHCAIWLQESLKLAASLEEGSSHDGNINIAEVYDYLSFSLYQQGDLFNAAKFTDRLILKDPSHERAQLNKKIFDKLLLKEAERFDLSLDSYKSIEKPVVLNKNLTVSEYQLSEEFVNYEALCRGEDIIPNPHLSNLKCRYVHHRDPLLLLTPIKEEELYLNPRLLVLRDFISDHEIKVARELSLDRLDRATAKNKQTGKYEPAFYRISQSGWIKDEEHPVIAHLSKRMSAYSKLSIETVEELQVQNYGLGGQYEPHYDFSADPKESSFPKTTGNRAATFLMYMTDVEAGGSTVFVRTGIKVLPVRGDAAFWYNLLSDNSGDFTTRHAGCPVLVGSKWVANKWFHVGGSEFTLPCSCSQYQPFMKEDFPQLVHEKRPICSEK